MDLFLGINIGKYGIPGMGNPYLRIPSFGQALEQDRAQWEESQQAQFGDQYSFFQEGPTSGFVADWSVISRSPRGGGPGHSLISTDPPLSLEATGAILEQLGKPGGPASSSKRRSRSRRKCKPGYRWNGHRCVRKD